MTLHQVRVTQWRLLHKNVKIVGTIHGIREPNAQNVGMGTMMGYLTVQAVDDTLSMVLLGLRDPVVPVDMQPINNTKNSI